jgi:RNA polymerase sigma factor (TIGR02999 family)
LLHRSTDGDQAALDRLVPLLSEYLRRAARDRFGHDGGTSLNTTALVHDAYLRLVDLRRARFRDRAHFLAVASRLMRRLLIDQARARRAARRARDGERAALEDAIELSDPQVQAIIDLDEALQRLERVDPRQSDLLEQQIVGGLSLEEMAEAVGISLPLIKRELRFARAWLASDLGPEIAH